MSIFKTLALSALILAPVASQAVALRVASPDEIAVQKVTQAVVQNDLKFVTTDVENLCGNTGLHGTEVKVQIAAVGGRFITIRHYGVTDAGLFRTPKAIECAN